MALELPGVTQFRAALEMARAPRLPGRVPIPEHTSVFFSFTSSKAISLGFCWPAPFPCTAQSAGGGQELTWFFDLGRRVTRRNPDSSRVPAQSVASVLFVV